MKKIKPFILFCLVVFFVSLFQEPIASFGEGATPSGGCPKKDKNCNPPNCIPIKDTSLKVILRFPFTYPGIERGCSVPQNHSDPAFYAGSSTLSKFNTTYFCQIRIDPIAPPQYCKPTRGYTHIWQNVGYETTMTAPENVQYVLTVQFWERCESFCNLRFTSTRSYYEYSETVFGGTSFVFANLQFKYADYLCD